MIFGFYVAIQVLRYRAISPGLLKRHAVVPVALFLVAMHGFDIWLLSQPMIMRM
jgi:hypothetical protein